MVFLEQEVLLISVPKFHILFFSILLVAIIPYSAYCLSLLMVFKNTHLAGKYILLESHSFQKDRVGIYLNFSDL